MEYVIYRIFTYALARNMGAKGFSLFWYLMIPAATPSLLIGLKQAWSFAWHALIGAEILIGSICRLRPRALSWQRISANGPNNCFDDYDICHRVNIRPTSIF